MDKLFKKKNYFVVDRNMHCKGFLGTQQAKDVIKESGCVENSFMDAHLTNFQEIVR